MLGKRVLYSFMTFSVHSLYISCCHNIKDNDGNYFLIRALLTNVLLINHLKKINITFVENIKSCQKNLFLRPIH